MLKKGEAAVSPFFVAWESVAKMFEAINIAATLRSES